MKLFRSKCVWFAVLVIAVCLAVLPTIVDAHRLAEESAQLALLDEAVLLLDAFHEHHGQYPDSLESLALTFPDGGDNATLATLKYQTDGDHYSIVVQGAYRGREYRESR